MDNHFLLTLHAKECYSRLFFVFKFYFHYLVLFQKGVNTSFMNCDQVLSLSQLIHTWGLMAVLNFQMRLK